MSDPEISWKKRRLRTESGKRDVFQEARVGKWVAQMRRVRVGVLNLLTYRVEFHGDVRVDPIMSGCADEAKMLAANQLLRLWDREKWA